MTTTSQNNNHKDYIQKLPSIWNWNNQEFNDKNTKYNQQLYEVIISKHYLCKMSGELPQK